MNDKDYWYEIKYIRKKRKIRRIVTYKDERMKQVHFKIKDYLEKNLLFSKFTKAYIRKSSIFLNAKAHMYNDVFIKLDIRDFFNSINHEVLLETLYYELNKNKEKKVTKIEIAKIIRLCSIDKKGLPLGLITSPVLSNIYLKEFDNVLYGTLKKLNMENVIYTRYADDLTISFKSLVTSKQCLEQITLLVSKLLRKYKLKINVDKISMIDLNVSNHVRITGVSIIKDSNNYRKISVGRKRINDLYHKSIAMYRKLQGTFPDNDDYMKIKQIKGLESFIYSVEKKGYEGVFSTEMNKQIRDLGFNSLNELITNLPEKKNV
ncbi:reverse transcriptase domain-containing protein [Terribacillus saccharophilus]|uniref:reverse transcriptase domain-containing protein n=1 Tax=Terribacillus saccharophilus TaxID=361277 RepID=UPI0038010436